MRDNSILIDWLSFTSKVHSPEDIISLLGLQNCSWQKISGMHGYRERYWYDSISVHYAGRSDMGVWLEMSGQGCRAFETYGSGDYKSIFEIILSDPAVHITRLDIAFDDYTGILDIERICNDTLKHRYKSKMDYFSVNQSSYGQSVQIGNSSSDVVIRIYDKLSERLSKIKNKDDKEKIKDEISHWIRVELQLRDDRAKEFIRLLSDDDTDVGQVYCGVLKNYLCYGYYSGSKFRNFVYWDNLLKGASALSLYVKPGIDYNLSNCINFVVNSAGNAVDCLLKIYGAKAFQNMIDNRKISQNPKYSNLIDKYNEKKKIGIL